MAAKYRGMDDVEFFLVGKCHELSSADKIARRGHRLVVNGQYLLPGRVILLDGSGNRLNAFPWSQFIGKCFELAFGVGKETLAERKQASGLVVEKVFFLQQQIEM